MANEDIKTLLGMLYKQSELLNSQIAEATRRLVELEGMKDKAEVQEPATLVPAVAPAAAPVAKSRKGIGGRPALHVTCLMPDCKDPHQAQGLCKRHYAQVRRARIRSEEQGN